MNTLRLHETQAAFKKNFYSLLLESILLLASVIQQISFIFQRDRGGGQSGQSSGLQPWRRDNLLEAGLLERHDCCQSRNPLREGAGKKRPDFLSSCSPRSG